MCECLAYEGGGMWLCEACAPDWLERETLDTERLARIEALEEALREIVEAYGSEGLLGNDFRKFAWNTARDALSTTEPDHA